LAIRLSDSNTTNDIDLKGCGVLLDEIDKSEAHNNHDWLLDETEKFCQDRAVYNAVRDSLEILDGRDSTKSKGSIPSLLSDALGVSFDPHVGHDYIDSYSDRYDFYHHVEKRIPFDIDYLNLITGGGLPPKTLNIILAGTNVGKSLVKCHMAAACLRQNFNVLYITLEMAEERIAERIDANMMDVPMDEVRTMPRNIYERRMQRIKDTVKGKLIIKEYPTASANAAHFRSLLNDLKMKRNFKPDIIFIDYLNICASSRIKAGSNVNSYSYIKSIAEELRGLAVEFNVPIVSGTQTTRSGSTNTDPGMEDTSESFGLPATADFMIALIAPEELQQMNQMMIKQLKSRYDDVSKNKRFVIGVDRSRMKLYNVDTNLQPRMLAEPIESNINSKSTKFSGLTV